MKGTERMMDCGPHGAVVLSAEVDFARASMRRVLAATVAEINSKADENMRQARKVAKMLRELADYSRGSIAESRAWSFDDCEITELADIRRGAQMLAAVCVPFSKNFQQFVSEHGSLLDDDSKATIGELVGWATKLPSQLDPIWRSALARLDADIAGSSDEAKAVAAEWASLDTDGLEASY